MKELEKKLGVGVGKREKEEGKWIVWGGGVVELCVLIERMGGEG